jgi:CTP synthase (UTP-ammonia lyase)
LGIQAADHQETNPTASIPFISKLSCSLVGESQKIRLAPNTLTFQAYGKDTIKERFNCHYGLNEAYRNTIEKGGLKIAGVDTNGEVRIVALSNHRFYMATLFLPQFSSSPDLPHPLIVLYLKAALVFRESQQINKDRRYPF